ncbi:MAG: hypothetical protein DRP93_02910 [Candidatus Neomarinimicrobiota bacterium]|nr:MAG: hypothetical protein DRP93_02910 [Candidatus Neomarinimicrobiota bacterium]
MRIPKGGDYSYTVRVLEKSSTQPEDVTGWTGIYTIYYAPTGGTVVESPMTPVAGKEEDGYMEGVIPSSDTDDIVINVGMNADNNYAICEHSGFMSFSGGMNVEIPKVVFYEIGV